ncbi:serine/threonine protein kinase [Bacillus suaedae]|uniref:Serine/threonine protein kinase n=1 Tax=Halalkalibacter suaedae TaxID=2822140 RepID=A0A940WXZ9_9BACI|nr:serine/threonine protein kinase [Bacillus suaedae]
MHWETAIEELQKITVTSNSENELVTIKGVHDLQCVGVGTDAAVFRSLQIPNYAFKLYSDDKIEIKEREEYVYNQLGNTSYFPNCHGSGANFLILSFEEGVTLYDCIVKGIHIPERVIEDVDDARDYAKSKGLNPRDIHLKNILLHQGRAKLLDVSEYTQEGNDMRWDYLKKGYYDYYHVLDGRPIPLWVVETVRKWYNQSDRTQFSFQEFAQKVMTLFRFGQ